MGDGASTGETLPASASAIHRGAPPMKKPAASVIRRGGPLFSMASARHD
jgi:hypothetical protein